MLCWLHDRRGPSTVGASSPCPPLAGCLPPSTLPPLPPAHLRASPPAGRAAAPLVDLERWRVERLTLCPVGSLDLYRTAFTHKSALLPEERLQKVAGEGRRVAAGVAGLGGV